MNSTLSEVDIRQKYGKLMLKIYDAIDHPLVVQGVRTSWRTYLDPFCCQWGDTTFEEKLQFIELLRDNGFSIEEWSETYKDFWAIVGRHDIAHVADDALYRYAMGTDLPKI